MISYSSFSRPGDRRVNEDAVGALSCGGRSIFVVADGLGGHGGGGTASSYVVSRILHDFEEWNGDDAARFFSQTLPRIQEELSYMQAAERCAGGMRTTVAAAAVSGRMVTVAHVGDSRCYLLGPWGVRQRTLDHSVPQMLALAGEIRQEDIPRHPSRNQLLHALGDGDEELRVDMITVRRRGLKALLLCSDGFWEHMDERGICAARRHARTPEEWLVRMEQAVRESGKGHHMDNYSALGVFLDGR